MVRRVNILPSDYGRVLCDRTLRNEVLKQQIPTPPARNGIQQFFRDRPRPVLTGLLANFTLVTIDTGTGTVGPRLRAPLLLFLCLLALSRFAPAWLIGPAPSEVDRARLLSAGLLALVSALLFGTLFGLHVPNAPDATDTWVGTENITAQTAVLALLGAVFLWRRSLPMSEQDWRPTDAQRVFFLTLTVPWFALLLVADDLQRRYAFLWPLHAAILAYAVTDASALWQMPKTLRRTQQIALVILIVANATVLSKLEDWQTHGWAGEDSGILRSLDYVAQQVHRQGRNRAAIGYSLPGFSAEAAGQAVDPEDKVGREFDYVLARRSGVQNTDHCAEGVSEADEYRMVRLGPYPDPPEYIKLWRRTFAEFRRVGQFGEVLVMRRYRHGH
jgi:hypothetical protein